MSLIRTIKLTPHQAKYLKSLGFYVDFIRMLAGEVDEYKVWMK